MLRELKIPTMVSTPMLAMVVLSVSCSSEVKMADVGPRTGTVETTDSGESDDLARDGSDTNNQDARFVRIPVEVSTLKPVTNLYLIVDNSFSMTPIQQKAAAAIRTLMSTIARKKLNVNLHLLSTTDLGTSAVEPVTINFRGSDSTVTFPAIDSPTSGLFGNTFFTGRKITPVEGNEGTFIVEDMVKQVESHFSGGVLRLREDMTLDSALQMATDASDQIASFGSGGSDVEQPIAVVYRVAAGLPAQSNERHAFAIVTNEDDSTYASLVMGHRSTIAPRNTTMLRFNFQYTMLSYQYEKFKPATYKDGVLISGESWTQAQYYLQENNCLENSYCLPAGAAQTDCNQQQLERMRSRIASMGPNNARLMENARCSASNMPSYLTNVYSRESHPDPGCNKPFPGSNPSITYQQEFLNRHSAIRFTSPTCEVVNLGALYRPLTERITISGTETNITNGTRTIGSAEVGAKALENLRQKSGSKGFTVALVANNGTDSCGQANFDDASRLGQFLTAAVGNDVAPSLRNSVCADEYTAITNGLEAFIERVAKSDYPFSGTREQISKILILGEGNDQVIRTLSPGDFVVSDGKIVFRSGVVSVGETVKVVLSQ